MADPLADLRLPLTPLAPRPAFAAALRRRLEAELQGVPPADPGGHPVTVTALYPHLIARDAASAIRFYVEAFGAEEEYRLDMPDGRIGHAELTIGGFRIAVGDPFPGGFDPPTDAIPPASFTLIVDDCDAALARAVAAGADVERPAADEFYGHRTAVVRDPGGHRWSLQQPLRDMSPEEMQAAMLEEEG